MTNRIGAATFSRTVSHVRPIASTATSNQCFSVSRPLLIASHAGRMTVSHTNRMPLPSASHAGLMTLSHAVWNAWPTTARAAFSASQAGRMTVFHTNAIPAPSASHAGLITLFHTNWNARSEEHTSELQSRFDLVCRLLLEKKKAYNETLI